MPYRSSDDSASHLAEPHASHRVNTPAGEHQSTPHFWGLRVLIVDDEIDERNPLVRFLSLEGLSVFCVRSGTEALTRTRASAYRVIVLDMHLPDVLGLSILSEWRRTGVRIPVIAVTGWYPASGHEEAARALGAARFLYKPLDASDLAAAIREVVGESRTPDVQAPWKGPPAPAKGVRSCATNDLDAHLCELHQLALDGEAEATEHLFAQLLPLVERHLRAQRLYGIRDDLVHDAAVDALLDYAVDPRRFDSARGSLRGFIQLAARRNLLNALQSERRGAARRAALASEPRAGRTYPPSRSDYLDTLSEISPVLKEFTPAELRVFGLWLTDERDTEAFSRILSISDLSTADQRVFVRRVKERLIRRIQRWVAGRRNRGNG